MCVDFFFLHCVDVKSIAHGIHTQNFRQFPKTSSVRKKDNNQGAYNKFLSRRLWTWDKILMIDLKREHLKQTLMIDLKKKKKSISITN